MSDIINGQDPSRLENIKSTLPAFVITNHDDTDPECIYHGIAITGTAENAIGWIISRLKSDVDGIKRERYAYTNNSLFENIWDNRKSLSIVWR